MTDERLTKNFNLSEFVVSQTAIRKGIKNEPNASDLANIRNHLAPGLQKVRDLLGFPMVISSAFRSPMVNAAVGGSRTSQHMVGLAADFTAPQFGTPLEICRAIVKAGIDFDQLIFEGTWVHISFNAKPRRSVLTAHFDHGGVRYTPGLPS